MIESNKRIYYILMAFAALALVLTVMACIVAADWQLFYSMALAVPVALISGVVCMAMYLYPTTIPEEGQGKRKRRSVHVPDTMGFRWVTAGAVSLGACLLLMMIALLVINLLRPWQFVVLTLLVLAAMLTTALLVNKRICSIAGVPLPRRPIRNTLLEAWDTLVSFFV